jgi:hypothetical protein
MKSIKSLSLAIGISSLLLSSCSAHQSTSTEVFCSKAADLIIAYKREHGLTVIAGVYFANTTGITVFAGLEDDIAALQDADPVKYYDLGNDQAVMKLCKIEVKPEGS